MIRVLPRTDTAPAMIRAAGTVPVVKEAAVTGPADIVQAGSRDPKDQEVIRAVTDPAARAGTDPVLRADTDPVLKAVRADTDLVLRAVRVAIDPVLRAAVTGPAVLPEPGLPHAADTDPVEPVVPEALTGADSDPADPVLPIAADSNRAARVEAVSAAELHRQNL